MVRRGVMKLIFVGADHEVTGSCHYVEACGKKFIVDYGMEQGKNIFENVDLPVKDAELDFVLLTHAHIDHSGMLPLLYKNGFGGKIYATDATCDLCEIMLRDTAHIQAQDAEWRSRKGRRNSSIAQIEPVYTMEDADTAIRHLCSVPYNKIIDIADGISVRYTDVGHLLGSASIEVWLNENGIERKICFSGDLGSTGHPLIKEPQYTEEADYVLIESTYGDRIHAEDKPDYVKELSEIITRTFKRGGNVVIPAFAVGRTQEILYFIREIKEKNLVPEFKDFPVYVDSPMAVSATEIFKDHVYDCFAEEALEMVRNGINPISFPGLRLSVTTEESRAINADDESKVIISASGMCDAGRIKHHLKHNLWRKESTILFVGYQSAGTTGRTIKDGADEVKLFGEYIEVHAEITKLRGMSGHADKNGLLRWINAFTKKPKKVFTVHGEASSVDNFTATLRDEYGFDAYAPYSGTEIDLVSGEILYEAEAVPFVKNKELQSADIQETPVFAKRRGEKKTQGVYARLRACGDRITAVISRCKELSNKDLARFADQLNELAEKWDIKNR